MYGQQDANASPRQLRRATCAAQLRAAWRSRWKRTSSTVSEDSAPSASLDPRKAQAAAPHPGAPPEQRGGAPWPQWPASGRPKVEADPLATSRCRPSSDWQRHAILFGVTVANGTQLPQLRQARSDLPRTSPRPVPAR